jgi:UPF0755 protein
MKKFVYSKGVSGFVNKKTIIIFAFVAGVILVGSAAIVRKSYNDNLKPLSSSDKSVVLTVEPGSVPSEIADGLKSKEVIKSDWAFEWYIRNHNLRDQLKAGTYVFKPNMSIPEIAEIITGGKVASDLVTILPGKRLEQIKQGFTEAGFSQDEVETALDPKNYSGHPALTDKPKNASLEGYLYPESFQKTAETKLSEIIKLSLDEMQDRLTPEIRQAYSQKGLNLHEAVTLASIVEQEVSNEADRATVAQVFLKRFDEGIRLQSDATNAYAKINPAYDSYKVEGLPPGPIGNISEDTLQALAYPSQTDWLYFVSGDDGKTHFSKTLEEHEANIEKYCTTLCGR